MIVPPPERSPDFGPETPATRRIEHSLRVSWHERRVYPWGTYGRVIYTISALTLVRMLRDARRAA